MRVVASILCLLLVLPVVGADYETGDESWRDIEVDMSGWNDGPELEGSPMDNPRPGDAVFQSMYHTNQAIWSEVQGQIVIELFEEWAPNTTSNMIKNVENQIYNGIFFHRVIDDFVTQAGDQLAKLSEFILRLVLHVVAVELVKPWIWSINENLSHVDGAIGMARSQDPDSADSQWYIAETEAHGLDPENRDDEGYVTFGIVRNGMSHVRAIATVPTTDDPSGEGNCNQSCIDCWQANLGGTHL